MDIQMKKCFKCGIEKPLGEFHKHKMMKDGRLNKCAVCTRVDTKRWTERLPLGGRKNGVFTQDELMAALNYCPETGLFTSKQLRGPVKVGAVVGCLSKQTGYLIVQALGKRDVAHRLAWLWVYGKYPDNQLDHINGIRNDNRLVNLRPATNAENSQNHAICSVNTSGHTGVSWSKKSQKYEAYITANRKRHNLGMHVRLEDAIAARVDAKQKLHEFHPAPVLR